MEFKCPLKILHMASSHRWTGVAEPATRLAASQQADGHEVHFACTGGTSFERHLRQFDVPFEPGFKFDRRLNPAHFRHDAQKLRDWVVRHQPDIIHCHLPHDHWLAVLVLRRPFLKRAGRPAPAIVRTIHREVAPRADFIHRWLWGSATDRIVTVSSSMRDALIERAGLPAARVSFIPGAVDLVRFTPEASPTSIRDLYKIPRDAHVAGMVARMQPHRGHLDLLETIGAVAERVPNAFYALAGRGELKRTVIERVGTHPRADRLVRVGYHKDDLPELYAALDVLVVWTPGSDGSCRGMLEAMACGRPVAGARVGAIADTIEPGETGWLFEPGDRDGLSAVLIDALGDRERLARMGRNARRHVEEHHNFDVQHRHTLEAYREALAAAAG
jgi:glycosyltransferase involved in cell wall biosynthesis